MQNIKSVVVGVIAATVVVLSAFGGYSAAAQDRRIIEAEPAEASEVWECIVMIPSQTGKDLHEVRRKNVEDQLVEMGQDGWELIAMPYLKGVRYQVMVLKRPERN